MRWLAELRRPALKCGRVGHDITNQWRRGYLPADYFKDFRAVVVKVRQERCACTRCGAEIEPWLETERSGLSGFGAPQDIWDRIEAGSYWPDGGYSPIGASPESLGVSPEAPNQSPSPDQQRIAQLEEALRPFADFASTMREGVPPDNAQATQGSPMAKKQVTFGDFRRARNALTKQVKPDE